MLSSMSMTAQMSLNLYGLRYVPIPTRDRGLQYTIEAGVNHALIPISVDDGATNSPDNKAFKALGANIVLTYKINPNISLGAGFGLHFIKAASILGDYQSSYREYEGSGKNRTSHLVNHSSTEYGDALEGNRMDLFVRGTYRLSDARLSPFISVDAGLRKNNFDGIASAYNFVAVNNGTYKIDTPNSTYFVAPAIGFSLRTTNNSYLEIKAGYDLTPSIKEQVFADDVISGGTGGSAGKWNTHFDKANLSSFHLSLGFTHTLKLLGEKNPPTHEINYIYDQEAINNMLAELSAKELFEQACKMADDEGQMKYDFLMKTVYADHNNDLGYRAAAFNNIGVMLYNRGDYKNAKLYLEQALFANPQYYEAEKNLDVVKSAISEKRWNNVINVLSVVGETATTLGNTLSAQGEITDDNGNDNETIGNNMNGNTSKSTKAGKCKRCQGSGVCSPLPGGSRKNACHGSKLCSYCSGTGWIKAGASEAKCTACNGSGKCKTCKGKGYCPACKGKG